MLTQLLAWLTDKKPPRRPGKMRVFLKGKPMKYYKFEVQLPTPVGVDPGRDKWVLTPSFDGAPGTATTGPITDEKTELLVPQLPGGGSPVVYLQLQHGDMAGNLSLASEFSFSQADNIPPTRPGEFGVTLLGEVDIPDEPAAPVEPAIPDEPTE